MDSPRPDRPRPDTLPDFSAGWFFVIALLATALLRPPDPDVEFSWVHAALVHGAALVHWQWCVLRLHRTLAGTLGPPATVGAWRTVLLHAVPVFNVIWLFRWPARALAAAGQAQTPLQRLRIGALLLLAVVLQHVGWAASDTTLAFTAGGLALLTLGGSFVVDAVAGSDEADDARRRRLRARWGLAWLVSLGATIAETVIDSVEHLLHLPAPTMLNAVLALVVVLMLAFRVFEPLVARLHEWLGVAHPGGATRSTLLAWLVSGLVVAVAVAGGLAAEPVAEHPGTFVSRLLLNMLVPGLVTWAWTGSAGQPGRRAWRNGLLAGLAGWTLVLLPVGFDVDGLSTSQQYWSFYLGHGVPGWAALASMPAIGLAGGLLVDRRPTSRGYSWLVLMLLGAPLLAPVIGALWPASAAGLAVIAANTAQYCVGWGLALLAHRQSSMLLGFERQDAHAGARGSAHADANADAHVDAHAEAHAGAESAAVHQAGAGTGTPAIALAALGDLAGLPRFAHLSFAALSLVLATMLPAVLLIGADADDPPFDTVRAGLWLAPLLGWGTWLWLVLRLRAARRRGGVRGSLFGPLQWLLLGLCMLPWLLELADVPGALLGAAPALLVACRIGRTASSRLRRRLAAASGRDGALRTWLVFEAQRRSLCLQACAAAAVAVTLAAQMARLPQLDPHKLQALVIALAAGVAFTLLFFEPLSHRIRSLAAEPHGGAHGARGPLAAALAVLVVVVSGIGHGLVHDVMMADLRVTAATVTMAALGVTPPWITYAWLDGRLRTPRRAARFGLAAALAYLALNWLFLGLMMADLAAGARVSDDRPIAWSALLQDAVARRGELAGVLVPAMALIFAHAATGWWVGRCFDRGGATTPARAVLGRCALVAGVLLLAGWLGDGAALEEFGLTRQALQIACWGLALIAHPALGQWLRDPGNQPVATGVSADPPHSVHEPS